MGSELQEYAFERHLGDDIVPNLLPVLDISRIYKINIKVSADMQHHHAYNVGLT